MDVTPTATQPMLTITETAERLRVSVSTVRRLLVSGDLVGFRIGHQVRFAPEAIDAYLASHTTRATTAA